MSTLHTEEMTLNMGPQHPSTHGVLRFIVRADGEVMREAIPDVGYLHRSIEKIAEKVGYHGFMPYTDRVDYVCAMFTNQGWGMASERLGGIEVPKRGEYCRVIAAEFNRLASHLLSVGTMAMVEAILLDEKRLFPCAVMLNGEYGIKDTFCGTMIKRGAGGAEEVYEVPVSEEEKAKIVAAAKGTAELAAII